MWPARYDLTSLTVQEQVHDGNLTTTPDQPTSFSSTLPVPAVKKTKLKHVPGTIKDPSDPDPRGDVGRNLEGELPDADNGPDALSQVSETFEGLVQSQDSSAPNVMTPSPLRPRRELVSGAGDSASFNEGGGVFVTHKHNVSDAPNVQVRGHSSNVQTSVSPDTLAVVMGLVHDLEDSMSVALPTGTCLILEPS